MQDFEKVTAGDPAADWLALIGQAKKREHDWRSCAREALARYADERPSETNLQYRRAKKFNILWANTEVLMSHLCVDLGTPDVRRQFTAPGKKTKIAKLAAEVLEKAMKVEGYVYDITHEFEQAIEDHLLPGRGVCWLELIAQNDDEGNPTWLEAQIVHVPWDRFFHGSADHWSEIPWLGRELAFTRAELRDLYPDYADDIPVDHAGEPGTASRNNADEDATTAQVYEVWCKETGQRFYVAEGFQKVLKADDDPYRLKTFWPCSKPLYAVKPKESLQPTPLYWMYADQAQDLDRLVTRRNRLIESMKYCGVYATLGDDHLPDMAELDDGQFVPYKNWAALQEKGGLANIFMVRDLSQIKLALDEVTTQKQEIVADIYQITGISDIIRGQTNPDETFGAQLLKARFGSNRSARWQRKVQRFVRDLYRIKAELIAEHYSRDQLQEMTGIVMPTREEQEQAKQGLQQAQAMLQQAQQGQQAQAQQAASPSPTALPAPSLNGAPPPAPGAMPGSGMPPGPGPIPMAPQGQMAAPPMGLPAPAPQPPQAPLPQFDPDDIQDLQAIVAAIPWEDIRDVLRSDTRRLMMVDVETDDTAFEDEEKQKEAAIEFLGAFGNLLQQVIPAVQANPVLLPLLRELVLFMADNFKVGQAFEDTINETFDKIAKMPPPPPPDKGKGAQGNPQVDAAKAQAVQQQAQAKIAADQAKAQSSQQSDMIKAQAVQAETQARLQNDALDKQMAREEHAATMQERQQNMRQDQEVHMTEMQRRAQLAGAEQAKLHLQLQEMQAKLAAAGLPQVPLGAAAIQPNA